MVLTSMSSPKPAFAIFRMASLVSTVCARQTVRNKVNPAAIVPGRLIMLAVYYFRHPSAMRSNSHFFGLSLNASSDPAPLRGFHSSHLGGVAGVLPVDLAQKFHQIFLGLLVLGGGAHVDEIVEPAQLAQAVLAAEFVEPRNPALAVADQIQRGDIDLPGGALQAPMGRSMINLAGSHDRTRRLRRSPDTAPPGWRVGYQRLRRDSGVFA